MIIRHNGDFGLDDSKTKKKKKKESDLTWKAD